VLNFSFLQEDRRLPTIHYGRRIQINVETSHECSHNEEGVEGAKQLLPIGTTP